MQCWCDDPTCMGDHEEEPFVPEEEDDYIGDARGGYDVSHAGRYIGTYETLSRATAALYLARCADSYWPNIWYVNYHGNVTLCVFDGHSITFTDTAYV